jgi:hypothetical protein
MRDAGLTLTPTFVPFTPWTTLDGYLDLLRAIVALGLVDSVAPIQLAIRLLVPLGSGLIEILDAEGRLDPYDEAALCHPWRATDPAADRLQAELMRVVEDGEASGLERREIFRRLWDRAHLAAGVAALPVAFGAAAAVPRPSEPWYCCAEPTSGQLAGL